MFRFSAAIALVLTAAGELGLAQDRPVTTTRRPTAATTLRMLHARVPEIQFQETPFDQVIEWLADFTKLNITVRWQILADAGIERDKPISIRARNLRISQILWLIMNDAGGETKLAYRAVGDLLVLSTAEDLNKEMVTKVYDVADLLILVPQALRQSTFDVAQGLGQVQTGGGGGSQIFTQGAQGTQQQAQTQLQPGQIDPMMQQLIELITRTIEPESWEVNGGLGTILPFQKTLVVHNSPHVHELLGGPLLEGATRRR